MCVTSADTASIGSTLGCCKLSDEKSVSLSFSDVTSCFKSRKASKTAGLPISEHTVDQETGRMAIGVHIKYQ